MHDESLVQMKKFVDTYLDPTKELKILDVGSWNKGPQDDSYRPLFDKPGWSYCGGDIVEGSNVDIIFKEDYNWCIGKTFDVIISGQVLEHVKDVKEWAREMKSYLNKGGFVCIIAPFEFQYHAFPVDCWRIMPDGMRWLLAEVMGLKILEIYRVNTDTVGMGQWV